MQLKLGQVKLPVVEEMNLPRMVPVKQTFASRGLPSSALPALIRDQFHREEIRQKVKAGMRIAIGVGSRGIDSLLDIVRCTVQELKQLGALPFIVPAMGSHGGGTAAGQQHVLAEYGITEENVGVPIRSSMDTCHLGTVLEDVEVYFDKVVIDEADGYMVISRIKPHTDFKAPIESGILKMLGIGLGKHRGASYLHRGGMSGFDLLLPAVGGLIMERTPFLFGLGLVEDAYHQAAIIELITKEQLPEREQELLEEAKRLMPRFWLQEIDVLVVDEIGKNISGSGLDPNIVGRTGNTKASDQFKDAPPINKVVILGLTEETNGNAVGIGLADFTTRRLVQAIDFEKVYINAITAVETSPGKLPLILAHDKEALSIAVYTGGRRDFSQVKLVRIRNTLSMNEIWVSENMIPEVERHAMMEVIGSPREWRFDADGYLLSED
ncbi:hypothetical protein [Paenibacillus koleovorans]|uniref:hypothetical protein n=1 Tax=Paenibacillus koleovorans TaxID=121608 RepID=UPI000FD89865|nr:hypothetical protein [Paenibacillus koleovorans]